MEWRWSGWWSGCQEVVIRLSSRSFRNSSPPQLECKQPYSCSLFMADCLPGCLSACRAAKKKTLGPWRAITVGSAGRLPGICMAWPDLGLVSCSRRRLPSGCLVGLLSRAVVYCTVCVHVRISLTTDGQASQDRPKAGACQLARSISRRMGLAVKTGEDRFLAQLPRPSTACACGSEDGSFARETWIIVVKLSGRASESDH